MCVSNSRRTSVPASILLHAGFRAGLSRSSNRRWPKETHIMHDRHKKTRGNAGSSRSDPRPDQGPVAPSERSRFRVRSADRGSSCASGKATARRRRAASPCCMSITARTGGYRPQPGCRWSLCPPQPAGATTPGILDTTVRSSCPFPPAMKSCGGEDRLYDVVVVLDCNIAPAVQGQGQRDFLSYREGRLRPTEGCVAVSPEHMRLILLNNRLRRRNGDPRLNGCTWAGCDRS